MALTPPLRSDRRLPIRHGLLPSDLPPETVTEQKVHKAIKFGKLRLNQKKWCDALYADSFFLSTNALVRKYQTSDETVKAVILAYQDDDNARVCARKSLSRLLELTVDKLKQAIETRKLPTKMLPVLLGILHDKLAQMDAGVVPGTDGKTQVEVDANAANAVLDVYERLKALKAGSAAVDVPLLPNQGGGGGQA